VIEPGVSKTSSPSGSRTVAIVTGFAGTYDMLNGPRGAATDRSATLGTRCIGKGAFEPMEGS
jgi:hypothetical protein